MGQGGRQRGRLNRREAHSNPQEREAAALRVVIDTNVILDAVFRNDKWAQQVLYAIQRREIIAVFSPPIVDELSRTFCFAAEEAGRTPADIVRQLSRVIGLALASERCLPRTKVDYCHDKDDNKFVECALDGGAACILTRNTQDFLGVPEKIEKRHGRRIEILSSYQFVQRVFQRKGFTVRP